MRNEEIILKLAQQNITIATAESCTGGSLGKIITSVPGVSSIYGYGFITYANEAKEKVLGVSHETLSTCVYGFWAGEVLSLCLIKIFKLKTEGSKNE